MLLALCAVIQPAYASVGQTVHEWLGIVMTVGFVLHQIQNRKWYAAAFGRKRTKPAKKRIVFNLALDLCFVLTAVSGILMSRRALPIFYVGSLVATSRALHLAFSRWTFILMGVHLGLHWRQMLPKDMRSKALKWILNLAAFAAAIAGVVLMARSSMFDEMFFRTAFAFFDYSASAAEVIFENVLMFEAVVFITERIKKCTRRNQISAN